MDLSETSKPVITAVSTVDTSKPAEEITVSQFIPPPLKREDAQLIEIPPRVDGRKRPRSEAQLLATKLMKENRHKSLTQPPESETAKDEKRKKKLSDIDELISKRMDTYHAKLLEELEKPLTGFLDKYIDDYYSDDETPSAANHIDNKSKENEQAEIKENTTFPDSRGNKQWGKQTRTSLYGTTKPHTSPSQRRKFL
jgi:hypothetical protein